MPHKILIVDDEPHIAQIMKLTLEDSGYEVTVAHDGAKGLEMAKESGPDLILLDLMLPSIDGYKICRLLKLDEKYQHIPVILVSAMGEPHDIELGEDAGADAFLSKPFRPDDILSHVRDVLSRWQCLPG
jgi:DNA-binding response OmpR family regulator